jgi:hypothetical protein
MHCGNISATIVRRTFRADLPASFLLNKNITDGFDF